MPKLVDHGARRQEFLSASLGVIAREGIEAATLKRVAGDAGFTVGAISHYFDTHRDLLVETLRRAHQSAADRMYAAIGSDIPPEAQLRAVIHEGLPMNDECLREWRVWAAFWGAAIGDDELAAENTERYARWHRLLEQLCAAAFGPECAATNAALLVAVIDGLGLQIALKPDGDVAAIERERAHAAATIDALLARF